MVFLLATSPKKGFPDSSVGKESTCNAGDPRLIPGLGRSPGEEEGYPLQFSGLENSSPWGRKESDTTERLSLSPSPKRTIQMVKDTQEQEREEDREL